MAFGNDNKLHIVFQDDFSSVTPILQYATITDTSTDFPESVNLLNGFPTGIAAVKITSPIFVTSP